MLPDPATARALGRADNPAAAEQIARNRETVNDMLRRETAARQVQPTDIRRAKPYDRTWIGRWIRRITG